MQIGYGMVCNAHALCAPADCVPLNVSPTLYQADLKTTNHRRQKSPPSFTLLSFRATPMTKTDLIFQHFLQDFKFSFNEERRSSQV